MKRWLLCCLFLLAGSVSAQSAPARVKCVLDSYHPQEMRACQRQEMASEFGKMNQAYLELRKIAPAAALPALADSQVKWAAYRDASCRAMDASFLDASMPGGGRGTCEIDMTKARKAWLVQARYMF